jgi:hypothetical protein
VAGPPPGFSHDPLGGSFAPNFRHFRRFGRDRLSLQREFEASNTEDSYEDAEGKMCATRIGVAANDAAAASSTDDCNGVKPPSGKNGTYAIPCAARSSMKASSLVAGLPVDLRRCRPAYEPSRYVDAGLAPVRCRRSRGNLDCVPYSIWWMARIGSGAYEDRISK